MVKTHEINLNTSTFNKFSNSDYIIIESEGISINDYILFRQVETIDGEEHVTDLYKLVQVKDIINMKELLRKEVKKMIKTHEINLSTSIYNTLLNTNSAIIQDDEKKITENDYVLFKQVEIVDEKEQETGLYMFVKIKKSVSNHVGLKEGYIMITYDEVN